MEYSPEYPLPIVTRDDIRVISEYVATGKLLPLTAADVKKEIHNAPENLVTEMVKNYNVINTHAKSWEKTQDSMIKISSVLVAFSLNIHTYGDDAVNVVKAMDGYKTRKIDSLTKDELNSFKSISLDGDDELQIPTLLETVKYLKDSINEKKRKSSVALVDSFKNILLNTIEPWVGKMLQASSPDALDTEISNIRRELIKLTADISEIKIKPSFMSDLFHFAQYLSPITLLVADQHSSSKPGGNLIKHREELLQKIATDNKLKGVLHTLNIGMGSLYDVVNPAIKAVTQLHSHWENIIALIDDASNQFKSNTSYAYLGLFVRKLEALLQDWQVIENNSTALMDAFRLDIK
jgi:hypothetical protein